MGELSKIEWTDHTFNPWIGCTKVSPGCANCYAEGMMDKRLGKVQWGKGKPRVRTSEANWRLPLKWNREAGANMLAAEHILRDDKAGAHNKAWAQAQRRQRVFCASLADWLDPEVPVEWLADLLDLIRRTPHLDWLLLTKRPQLCLGRMQAALEVWREVSERDDELHPNQRWLACWIGGTPPANVWIGTSVEDQTRADERIPALIEIPAKVRFLSCEPLLGEVDLGLKLGPVPVATWWPNGESTPEGPYPWQSRWVRLRHDVRSDPWAGAVHTPLHAPAGIYRAHSNVHGALSVETDKGRLGIKPGEFDVLPGVDWVIAGGESGPNARPMHPDWARSLRDQCKAAGVPFLLKQWGEWRDFEHGLPDRVVDHDSQDADEAYKSAINPAFVTPDGRLIKDREALPYDTPCRLIERLGKKAAGRHLDGVLHNEFPEVQP